jgi:hypothetical protein
MDLGLVLRWISTQGQYKVDDADLRRLRSAYRANPGTKERGFNGWSNQIPTCAAARLEYMYICMYILLKGKDLVGPKMDGGQKELPPTPSSLTLLSQVSDSCGAAEELWHARFQGSWLCS